MLVYRSYEILEVMPDGSTVKRNVVSGVEFAKVTLESLAKRTSNECIAADKKTHQVVAQLNIPPAKRSLKRIFQIAYDEEAGLQRAELLRGRRYGVISVLDSKAAKNTRQPYDFFIVGHAAPEQARKEIIAWLKANYPQVPILALNPPSERIIDADYNAVWNGGPENWLPLVTERLTRKAAS